MSRVFITGSADGLGLVAGEVNAGIGYREPRRVETDDGLEHVFAVTCSTASSSTVRDGWSRG